MLLSMLLKKISELAPIELGLSNDIYGLQFGSIRKDINLHKIVICIDPSIEAILHARKLKSYFIIAHHGLIHHPLLYFSDAVIKQIKLLSINNISLFILHSAWISASGGISDTISEVIGLKIIDYFFINDNGDKKPIGRIGIPMIEVPTFEVLIQSLKRKLNSNNIQVSGKINSNISKIAVICGITLKESDFIEVLKKKCDTLITTDLVYSQFILAQNLGINVVNIPHYICDKIAMIKLQKILSLEFPRDEFIYFDSNNPIILAE
ncbi:MAG: Nif3-like dinuclear metal center hexameric protein [Promethearchaeota archaeon]